MLGDQVIMKPKDQDHQRMKIFNITIFGCMIKAEAYDTNMPFRFCPSCGKQVDETEEDIRKLLET